MYDDLYCKVFVDTDIDYEKLFALLINYVDGKKEAVSYIVTEWCDISVQKNKEYNVEQYLLDATDFLYWKYYLDIEPHNIDKSQYIKNIANLLRCLGGCCKGVIIACDFEDEINNM